MWEWSVAKLTRAVVEMGQTRANAALLVAHVEELESRELL